MPLSIVKCLHLAAEASSGFVRCYGCPSSERDLGRTDSWQRDDAGPRWVPKPASLFPFPVGLRIWHAKSSCQPGPLFLSWPTRKRPLGLQGPKIALVFLSRPPGTADMRRMELTSTRHRPGGGWPLRVRPSFCQGTAGQPLQILGAGEMVMLWEDVLFWLFFNSSTPLLNWKQLCSLDQPPKNCRVMAKRDLSLCQSPSRADSLLQPLRRVLWVQGQGLLHPAPGKLSHLLGGSGTVQPRCMWFSSSCWLWAALASGGSCLLPALCSRIREGARAGRTEPLSREVNMPQGVGGRGLLWAGAVAAG